MQLMPAIFVKWHFATYFTYISVEPVQYFLNEVNYTPPMTGLCETYRFFPYILVGIEHKLEYFRQNKELMTLLPIDHVNATYVLKTRSSLLISFFFNNIFKEYTQNIIESRSNNFLYFK